MATGRYSALTLYQRLLSQARTYWPHIGGILLLGLLSNPLALLTPVPLQIAVDGVLGSQPIPHFLEVLLPPAYDPTDGQILLDGVDLRDYKLADLRNQFAVVLREPVLFSTSIAENIAYARPGAGDDEVIAAAKAANAHEFIIRLPRGYEAQVGERGMQLSGGERQRIALARAFLKDAPILILDEPTSSVDITTEATIIKALEQLMRGRTTFMIAHHVSTLAACEVRLDIEGGPLGGMAWHHLQYVLGLRQLGHEVWFVEDSDDVPWYGGGPVTGSRRAPRAEDTTVDGIIGDA